MENSKFVMVASVAVVMSVVFWSAMFMKNGDSGGQQELKAEQSTPTTPQAERRNADDGGKVSEERKVIVEMLLKCWRQQKAGDAHSASYTWVDTQREFQRLNVGDLVLERKMKLIGGILGTRRSLAGYSGPKGREFRSGMERMLTLLKDEKRFAEHFKCDAPGEAVNDGGLIHLLLMRGWRHYNRREFTQAELAWSQAESHLHAQGDVGKSVWTVADRRASALFKATKVMRAAARLGQGFTEVELKEGFDAHESEEAFVKYLK